LGNYTIVYQITILLPKQNQKMFFEIKRTGGVPSGPVAETAREQRGLAPTAAEFLQKRPHTIE
jgi:hypothetical protein